MLDRVKKQGGVYTPKNIINDMLDFMGYTAVLEKHIMENSCGDGAFLVEIVNRYCKAFLERCDDLPKLKNDLQTYIHGIEKESGEAEKCRKNLDIAAAGFGLRNVKWDVSCADSLAVTKYNGKMDYVVGNPPYIRVHNLDDSYNSVKKFKFAQNGMVDMYIVFFEIGLNMLKPDGKMCLITPSSFLSSRAGAGLRQYIREAQTLSKAIDLGHYQAFDTSTYSIITLFDKSRKSDTVLYKDYATGEVSDLSYEEIFVNKVISFDNSQNLALLADIDERYKSQKTRDIVVKNGLATLSDKIFIGEQNKGINILKASTGKWSKCIFPYHSDGTAMSETELKKDRKIYDHLFAHKKTLLKRDADGEWFLFGRSQGVKDVFRHKIAINTIIKDVAGIKLAEVPTGSAVYSGLYILSSYSLQEVQSVLLCNDFINYLKILKKYKHGGYYTFSSLDLEKYLVYKLKGAANEQRRVLATVN